MTGLGMMELGWGEGATPNHHNCFGFTLILGSWNWVRSTAIVRAFGSYNVLTLATGRCKRSKWQKFHTSGTSQHRTNIQPASPSVHSGALPSASKTTRLGPEICWDLLKACNFAMVSCKGWDMLGPCQCGIMPQHSWICTLVQYSICSFCAPKEDCSEFL